jgi:hypothetical protein
MVVAGFGFSFTGYRSVPEEGTWLIDSESRLLIHGSTNVNSFTCSLTCYQISDTLVYVEDKKECKLKFLKNTLSVPLQNFDCGNTLITRDCLKALKAGKFPQMNIHFITLNRGNGAGPVSGDVEIELAGVTRKYTMMYSLKERPNEHITLTGTQAVCFSDFDLSAPQRLMGLIQVQENLKVEFQIVLKPI